MKGLTKVIEKNPFYPSPKAETFESETVAFESFRGRWNVGQTRDIEGSKSQEDEKWGIQIRLSRRIHNYL